MIKLKDKRVCNNCKQPAKIWHNKQWWCTMESHSGTYNLVGVCDNKEKSNAK